jgi:hypothetical protein
MEKTKTPASGRFEKQPQSTRPVNQVQKHDRMSASVGMKRGSGFVQVRSPRPLNPANGSETAVHPEGRVRETDATPNMRD